MPKSLDPFRLLLVSVAGWMNHQQQQVIDYLREENRVLREQLGTGPLRFDDDQRRRLAVRARACAVGAVQASGGQVRLTLKDFAQLLRTCYHLGRNSSLLITAHRPLAVYLPSSIRRMNLQPII